MVVSETKLGGEALLAEVERLRAERDRLQAEVNAKPARAARSISFKVSEKGGVSVYGLGRFPVTLYREQWETLLPLATDLLVFIEENAGKLKVKGA